ncbi:MAG: type II toxin-antitoxin system prevent-host-death family antitoxin [Acidobacteriota bacterium]
MDKTREIAAGEFKTHCLALLDEVAETGREIIVTKRGKPVAKVTPIEPPKSLKGSVKVIGDIINIIDPDEWEINRD